MKIVKKYPGSGIEYEQEPRWWQWAITVPMFLWALVVSLHLVISGVGFVITGVCWNPLSISGPRVAVAVYLAAIFIALSKAVWDA